MTPEDLVTGNVFTADGRRTGGFTMMGNGQWEMVMHRTGEYTITAEAEGYTVEPASYKILVEDEEDETAYVVEDGEIGEEALHLDFHFSAE